MKMWDVLKEGDLIDLVAPSGNLGKNQTLLGVVEAIESMGYRVRYDEAMVCDAEPYHANTDEYRSRQLNKALLAEDSKAVWCLRGGYGVARLLSSIPETLNDEKIVIGFSDITALNLFLHQKFGWNPIHGDVGTRLIADNVDADNARELFALLSGQSKEVLFDDLEALNGLQKDGVKASITGGNLALLQTSLGTKWQIDASGCVLFIEDVSERGYQVDRMLEHMRHAGVFEGVKAVVFGEFICSQEPTGEDYIGYSLKRFAQDVSMPVYKTNSIGHGRRNLPIIIGAEATIEQGCMTVQNP